MSDGIGKAKRARVMQVLIGELAQSLENDGATPEDIRVMAFDAALRALAAHRERTGEPDLGTEELQWQRFCDAVNASRIPASLPVERPAEAYICGVLDPDTLALEDIILFSNWKGYNGSLPMQTETRNLRKPMVVIHHVRGTDVEDCRTQLREIWSVTLCAEGAIHARFPWESFAR